MRTNNPRILKYITKEIEAIRQRKKTTQTYIASEIRTLADGVYFPFLKPTEFQAGYGCVKRLFPEIKTKFNLTGTERDR